MNQTLRPCRQGDERLLIEAIEESRPELVAFGAWCHATYSIDDAKRWVETQLATETAGGLAEMLIVGDEDELLGVCGINQVDSINKRANLGYWVRTSACGRGIATRAVTWLAAWAFATTDLERLEIVVSVQNGASLRVAEKAGAVREGILRRRLRLRGVSHDAVVFSIVRTDGQRL